MSLAQSLSLYLTLNIMVCITFLILWTSFQIFKKLGIAILSKSKLQIYYWSIILMFAMVIAQPLLPRNNFFSPTARVWSAESTKSFYHQYNDPSEAGFLTFSFHENSVSLSSQTVTSAWKWIGFALALFGGILFLKDLILLYRIKKNSYLLKKMGRVSIFLNDHIQVPFSYFLFGAQVIIPSSMIAQMTDLKIAISHELQHHRQNDTRWIYVLWTLRLVCVANPFMHLWVRQILEMQEFACDEALIGRKKVKPQSYARCLLQVAQTAIDQKKNLVCSHLDCATGLILLIERNLLKRRIENMFLKQTHTKKSVTLALGFVLGLILSITAYATSNLVQDRRVTMKEAQAYAQKAKVNSNFPIVVNDLVLQELNRYLGTAEGREFMRKSLTRMESYRALVQHKLQEYQMPAELMAVPIIESGYLNLPQSENKSWGAGLWMFIESTARNYGLRVDSAVDERLNPEILTDAAMRYISANYSRFKDYQLAMMGYNIGENKVQEGINKYGNRDPWFLTRHGYDGDKYLARLMAAILIMKNPESVR